MGLKRGAVWMMAFVAGSLPAAGRRPSPWRISPAAGSFSAANGVTFGGFTVKVRGSLSRDLADYEVVPTADGFYLDRRCDATRGRARAARGRIQIRYDVTTGDPAGLLQARSPSRRARSASPPRASSSTATGASRSSRRTPSARSTTRPISAASPGSTCTSGSAWTAAS